MAEKSPQDILMAGAKILAPVLEPHEFIFELETRGKGSGGWFASGSFRRSDRRLELHFRYFLGLVSYHIDRRHWIMKRTCAFPACMGRTNILIFPKYRSSHFIISPQISRTIARILFAEMAENFRPLQNNFRAAQ